MTIKAVIDTNVLVSSLSSRSIYHWLLSAILNGAIDLFITDEILLEYEEVLSIKYSKTVSTNFLVALQELPNVHFTRIYYRWDLIKDKDDNKFVDCFVSAGADYLISNDNHFLVLKGITFPKVEILTIQEFADIFRTYS